MALGSPRLFYSQAQATNHTSIGPPRSGRLKVTFSHKGPITKHKGFLEDEDASKGHPDLMLTWEDFDSITSFAEDVVKLTEFQLNLVLAEGGGEHAKNRFGDNKRKIIPQFHPLQDVVIINPRPKCRFEDGLIRGFRPGQDKITRPFDV